MNNPKDQDLLMIKFSDITKRYPDGTLALHQVDIEINPGEFVFIVGPSGAGKTTLIKLLIREELPTSGSVFFEQQEVNKLRAKELPFLRRQIGVVFQDFKLLAMRTVFENVSLALEVFGKRSEDVKEMVEKVIGMVGLSQKIHSFPYQLSGGEKQRVSIARALVHNPKVLIADEPTAEVDPGLTWSIIDILNKINLAGTTVIVATHDPDIVNTLKRRVIGLDTGHVVKDNREGSYEF